MFVLTTFWFVLGTDFFAAIVRENRQEMTSRMRRLGTLSAVVNLGMIVVVTLTLTLDQLWVPKLDALGADLAQVLSQMPWLIGVLIGTPLVEMLQRAMVSLGHPGRVWMMSVASVLTSCALGGAAYLVGDVHVLMVGLSMAAVAGAVVGACIWNQMGEQA